MDLFTPFELPRYSKLVATVDYLSGSGLKHWTFYVQYNVHRYYQSLDEFYEKFLEICPDDFVSPISISFEIFYDFNHV